MGVVRHVRETMRQHVSEELAGIDQTAKAPHRRGQDAGRSATIVAEPLERGFGLTLGNALRRVLLSSLQGAAVTSIQIDGVLHEFSSIGGVREDVTDIVLNVKQIALRMHAEGPKRLSLKATGPGEITAGQIQAVADVEILNPDLVLCTLDEKVDFRMELTVATGKATSPPTATVRRTRRSVSFRSTACSRRPRRSPTRSRTPAKARFSTMTS